MSILDMISELLQSAKRNQYPSVEDAYASLFHDNPTMNYNDNNSTWDLNDQIIITTWKTSTEGTLAWRVDSSRELVSRSATCHFNDQQVNGLHSHNYLEITFVLEGTFEQIINGKHVTFHPGDVYLIDSRTKYQENLRAISGTVLFIGFSNDFFTEIMFSSEQESKSNLFLNSLLYEYRKKNDYVLFQSNGDISETISLLGNILNEISHRQVGSDYLLRGYSARLLNQLVENYSFSISSHDKAELQNIIFDSISNYIMSNYKNVSIKDLQSKFHYNRNYFNRLIHNRTGMTFTKYIQDIRLTIAQKNICNTDDTIEDIAASVGYNNLGYFYKIFKEKYNMTPAEMKSSAK